MTSYADDFTLLASASSIVEAEARENQLCSTLERWANGKQLVIASQKSSETLFTSDSPQSKLHPQVRIVDGVAPLNRTLNILGVTLDTHFTFGPHTRDCVEWASRALNVMKAIAKSNSGFTTEPLITTCKAIVRLYPQLCSPHLVHPSVFNDLDKLEVIQNKSLRISTDCHQKTAASNFRVKTEVLSLRPHIDLCSHQFYVCALQPIHPSHLIFDCPGLTKVHSPSSDQATPRASGLQSYRQSDFHSIDHTVARLLNCPTYFTDLSPGDM